ncbi:hypothetical protein [Nakamurella endophytica]|uniref:Uncharacterized protein n=1 Tax=Nakamurella endophytica TaxID=1748367 RepID=A0A917SVQ9_9ACTN|nr:hypothetical protein [Nakamurella endophytica]GGL98715.1 hypothetical protein GCM10011594_18270 [Nakamurella endophytica]
MPAPEHRSGSIPRNQRRFALVFAAVFFLVLLAAALLLKLVEHVDIPWIWVIVTPIFVTFLILMFLWVRLSD